MPIYSFECKNCKHNYETLQKHDPSGKYPGVSCPECNSKKKISLLASRVHVKFANPKESSKWDNPHYKIEYSLDKAQDERRAAEAASHMGGTGEIYNQIDDLTSDSVFGEVK